MIPGRTYVAIAVACLAGASSGLTAQTASASRAGLAGLVHDTVLANGLTIIVAESHTVSVATMEVVVRTGAFTQNPGEEGISHLYEHLLFRAYGGDQRFAVDVAQLEGFYNGGTAEEGVNYYITAPSKGMPTAVQMLARLVIGPSFRDADVEAERKIIRSEFDGDASDASFVLRAEMGKRVWGADWFRRDPLGTAESIQGLDISRLRQIYQRYYVPNNAALVVSGDVRTADVFAQAVRRFGGWKSAADPIAQAAVPSTPALAASQSFAVSSPHQRLVTVAIEWQGPGVRGDPALARAAESFSYLVNSPVSPLANHLVNAGLAQSATLSYDAEGRGGPITLTVVMLPAAVERTLPVLRAEIDQFASASYLNDSLLLVSKKARAVDAELGLERGSGIAHTVGTWWAVAGLEYFHAPTDASNQVGLPELERFVKGTMAGRPYVAGALTAPADVDRVRRVMEQTFGTGATR